MRILNQLARLIRYTARGAIALERPEQDANGDFLSTVTRTWSNGTTGIKQQRYTSITSLEALPSIEMLIGETEPTAPGRRSVSRQGSAR